MDEAFRISGIEVLMPVNIIIYVYYKNTILRSVSCVYNNGCTQGRNSTEMSSFMTIYFYKKSLSSCIRSTYIILGILLLSQAPS